MRFDLNELFQSLPRGPATRQNEIWSVELFRYGKAFILVALDVFSGHPMVLEPTSGSAGHATSKLKEASRSGSPETLWLDQSFELRSRDLQKWAAQCGIEILYGAPYQKAMIARRFLDELRDVLDAHRSTKSDDLKRTLAALRQRHKTTAATNI